jgi:hypothetical protein
VQARELCAKQVQCSCRNTLTRPKCSRRNTVRIRKYFGAQPAHVRKLPARTPIRIPSKPCLRKHIRRPFAGHLRQRAPGVFIGNTPSLVSTGDGVRHENVWGTSRGDRSQAPAKTKRLCFGRNIPGAQLASVPAGTFLESSDGDRPPHLDRLNCNPALVCGCDTNR